VTIAGTSALGALNPRTFTFRLGAPVGGAPVTFSNTTALTIPDIGVSAPYGTTVAVSGLTGNKLVKLGINGLTHTFPGDLDMLLVGPGGQKFSLVSDSGGGGDVSNLSFSLSDAAAAQPSTTQWVAGDFRPVNIGTGDPFAAPAPAAPYIEAPTAGAGSFNSVFGTTGSALNGTWALYVVDDAGGDFGTMTGWSLTFEANDFTCSLTPSAVESRADFDGDGKTDVSVFRPSEGNWYLNQSTAGFGVIKWGLNGDNPMPGDFDGDNKADLAVYRPVADPAVPDCYVLNSNGNTVAGYSWGVSGDIPMVADYDGDDKDDVAIFRPSDNTWYVLKSSGGVEINVHGQAGDVPVAGDFDGDGKGDRTVYRSGSWISQLSGGGTSTVAFGSAGDMLVPADYDGDNKDDIAVFRPSTGQWIYKPSSGGSDVFVNWGTSGDVPVPGDYDGDGKDDFAIYRNGQWWLNRSTAGVSVQNFGLSTDMALPNQYIP
jgi:subtilisin-like proprotein convertase family protein